MQPQQYRIRQAHSEEFKNITDIYNEFTGRERTYEQWLWQWVDTPFDKSESWVIEQLELNEIIGHHGVMFLPFTKHGEKISVGKTENTFVLKEHAKMFFYPAYEKTALTAMKDRFDYIYTTAPNAGGGAIGILRKRLGYTSLGRTVFFPLYLKSRFIQLHMQKKLDIPRLLLKILATFLSSPYKLKSIWLTLITKHKNLSIDELEWSNAIEVENFWKEHSKHYGITADRTLDYLSWRFKENPYINYSLVSIKQNKSILGYTVLRKSNATNLGNSVRLAIEDIIVANADVEKFYLALLALVKLSIDDNIDCLTISLLLQDDALNQAIKKFLGKILHKVILFRQPTKELLVWSRNPNTKIIPWYFTGMLYEGIRG